MLWWHRRCVLGGLVGGFVAAIVYLHASTPLYAASMEVAPATAEGSSDALRGMGGLAPLPG